MIFKETIHHGISYILTIRMIKSFTKILIEFKDYRFSKILASLTRVNEYKFSAESTKNLYLVVVHFGGCKNITVGMTGGIFGTSLFLPKLFEAKIQVRKESEIFSLVIIKFWLNSYFLTK